MSQATTPDAFGDIGPRTVIRMQGADSVSYLHNLCTQDIRALKPGELAEAFITSVQGKTLSYVRVLREEDSILLETAAGQASFLLAHFEKYHIREKVEFTDLSSEAFAFIATAHLLDAFAKQSGGESKLESRRFLAIGSGSLIVTGYPFAGAGYGLVLALSHVAKEQFSSFAENAGASRMAPYVVNAMRVAAGTPEFGVDVTDDNLPQEVGREALSISFKKGCYLGQETVARIDALGHVNRRLVTLRSGPPVLTCPIAGVPILVDGKQIGRVTSAAIAAHSNGENHPAFVALAYVKRGFHKPGVELLIDSHPWKVVEPNDQSIQRPDDKTI